MGSTVKGLVTGALTGLVARWRRSLALGAIVILAIAGGLPPALAGDSQTVASTDSLAPLAVLVGRWTGTSQGQPGTGAVDRTYERILGSRFVQVRNRSTYPAQGQNPKGEVHEDVGIFSFDSGRQRIIFRQFHVEGFVNQYALDPASPADRLVLTTEAIENIPAGWRARETYVLDGTDRLEEIFELAEPGKDFEVYSRTRLNRTR